MNLNHKKILVTGAKGMLGCDLLPLLQAKNGTILATARTATSVKAVEVKVLDITDYSAVRDCFTEFAPDIVINCAACTRVDDAEKEYDFAFDVNSYAPEFLADICKTFGSYLVHISTDYVLVVLSNLQGTPLI